MFELHMGSWLWSRAVVFSPAPNDSHHRIDIFADFSSSPSEQFHFMPDEFHLMPDKFHYMPDKFHLMPEPTHIIMRSFVVS